MSIAKLEGKVKRTMSDSVHFYHTITSKRFIAICITILIALAIASYWLTLSWKSDFSEDIYPEIPKSVIPSEEDYIEIKRKANLGDAESQLYMGVFYANGDRVEQDYSCAAMWYRKAAEQGNATAQRNLGLLYDSGVGVARNDQEAAKWYKKASRQAEPASFMGLARYAFTYSGSVLPPSEGSYNQFRLLAFALMNILFQYSNPDIEFWISYYSSQKYFQEDAQIVKQVLSMAQMGDADAQLRMAVFHFQGQAVPLSKSQFNKWLIESSNKNPRALFLANRVSNNQFDTHPMFDRPEFETIAYYNKRNENIKMACKSGLEGYFCFWHNYGRNDGTIIQEMASSALRGDPFAARYLYALQKFMKTEHISDETRFKIAHIHSEQGDVYAMVMMAVHYALGVGCHKDIDKSYHWMRRIIVNNDARGLLQLGNFLSGKKDFFNSDRSEIVEFIIKRSQKGDPEAQLLLGIFYIALQDITSAKKYLEKALIAGNAQAPFYLGMILIKETQKAAYQTDGADPEVIFRRHAIVNNGWILIDLSCKQRYMPAILYQFFRSRDINLLKILVNNDNLREIAYNHYMDFEICLFADISGRKREKIIDLKSYHPPTEDYFLKYDLALNNDN